MQVRLFVGKELKENKGVFGRAPRSFRSKKQLHFIFFLPNIPAPKTPDPPNPWI
jgi:hypothetical protein